MHVFVMMYLTQTIRVIHKETKTRNNQKVATNIMTVIQEKEPAKSEKVIHMNILQVDHVHFKLNMLHLTAHEAHAGTLCPGYISKRTLQKHSCCVAVCPIWLSQSRSLNL